MLPAATSLKRQGANKGATTAFLITTPESGVDSISITYALLDPLMTIVRPVAAFVSGLAAGSLENFLVWDNKKENNNIADDLSGSPAPLDDDKQGVIKKVISGLKYGFVEVWGDIVLWFFVGLIIAGFITVVVPEELMSTWLGGGVLSMFLMLLAGIPLYICATASTPIAAALILKGVSPGAALVFLLVGPATNITSITVLFGLLGKASTIRYLVVISVVAILFGLGVDATYLYLEISPSAVIGEATEIVPFWIKLISTIVLLLLSIKPVYSFLKKKIFADSQPLKLQNSLPSMSDLPQHHHGDNHKPGTGCCS